MVAVPCRYLWRLSRLVFAALLLWCFVYIFPKLTTGGNGSNRINVHDGHFQSPPWTDAVGGGNGGDGGDFAASSAAGNHKIRGHDLHTTTTDGRHLRLHIPVTPSDLFKGQFLSMLMASSDDDGLLGGATTATTDGGDDVNYIDITFYVDTQADVHALRQSTLPVSGRWQHGALLVRPIVELAAQIDAAAAAAASASASAATISTTPGKQTRSQRDNNNINNNKKKKKKENYNRLMAEDWLLVMAEPFESVSPVLFPILLALRARFFNPASAGTRFKHLFGLSLGVPTYLRRTRGYAPRYPYSHTPNKALYFALQHPQACGGVYPLAGVARFRAWLKVRGRVLFLQQQQGHQPLKSLSSTTSSSHSFPPLPGASVAATLAAFEGACLRFLLENGLALVYPGLTTPVLAAAAHEAKRKGVVVEMGDIGSRRRRRSSSSGSSRGYSGKSVLASAIRTLNTKHDITFPVYDGGGVYQKRHTIAQIWPDDTSMMQHCTLVMTVYSRVRGLVARLRYYHSLSCIAGIVVIWNNPENAPPAIRPTDFMVPVNIIRESVNSMNNRLKPRKEIKTDCVIYVDDDVNMARNVLNYAARLWARPGSRDALVGLRRQGRLHAASGEEQQQQQQQQQQQKQPKHQGWVYVKNTTAPVSIVLSPWVFHRKYLALYTQTLPRAARQLVDTTTNCEDLLFNFLVAQKSKRAPILVDGQGASKRIHRLKRYAAGDNLSDRMDHFKTRDMCLDMFSEMLGGMPLKYTRTMYSIHSAPDRPLPPDIDTRAEWKESSSPFLVVSSQQTESAANLDDPPATDPATDRGPVCHLCGNLEHRVVVNGEQCVRCVYGKNGSTDFASSFHRIN